MKNKVLSRSNLILFAIIFVVFAVITVFVPPLLKGSAQQQATEVAVQVASSKIQADGSVVSANEAILHFLTGGKLSYLPVKEGDQVYQGETIASLDTYALQKQVQIAANAYQTTKNSNDQTQENQGAGVLEGQQRTSLDTTNKNGYSNTPESQVITDQIQRIVDNSALAQNTAQLNVDLAHYAMQLATLTSPINGVLSHADVTNAGVNVSPTTTFIVDDPTSLVFRAQVLANDIDYIAVGQPAVIKMDNGKTITGTVEKIYPSKMTLANGSSVYQVDIQSPEFTNTTKMGETGAALINNIEGHDVTLVPSWTVVSKQYIWVDEQGKTILKKVTVGKEHGNMTEIVSGLSSNDKVIENPKSIINNKYQML